MKKVITIISVAVIIAIVIAIILGIMHKENDVIDFENLSDEDIYNVSKYGDKVTEKWIKKIIDKYDNIHYVYDKSATSSKNAKEIVLEDVKSEDKITKLKVGYENKYIYVMTYMIQQGDLEEEFIAEIIFKKEYFDVENRIIYAKNEKDIQNILDLYYLFDYLKPINVKKVGSEISSFENNIFKYSIYYIAEIQDHIHHYGESIFDESIEEIHNLTYFKKDIYIKPGEKIELNSSPQNLKVIKLN